MTRTLLALCAVGLLGCGSGGGGDKPVPADTASCGVQITKAIDGMIAKKAKGSALPPDRLARMERLRGVLIARCTEDHWPATMLTCLSTVTAQFELMRCQSALPPAQQQKLQAEIMATMVTAHANGEMPGHRSASPEAMLDKQLVELQDKTDLLVRELSEVKSVAERDLVNDKIEKNRADKAAVETQLRELRNRKAAGDDGSAGSAAP